MSTETHDRRTGVSRRQMISLGAATGLAAGLTGNLGVAEAQTAAEGSAMPVVDIAKISEIEPGASVDFTYPDDDSPALLVRLTEPVEGGVGPDETIVAYSSLCTHKGCPVNWNAEREMLICPCHWSTFDPAKNGRMIIGQGSQALPRVALKVEGDIIKAVGVEGLIYGRQTNIL